MFEMVSLAVRPVNGDLPVSLERERERERMQLTTTLLMYYNCLYYYGSYQESASENGICKLNS